MTSACFLWLGTAQVVINVSTYMFVTTPKVRGTVSKIISLMIPSDPTELELIFKMYVATVVPVTGK